MKKILTTTVMTAILATSGFAGEAVEPVDYCVYGTVDFSSGMDRNDTTIKPSGVVNIGDSSGYPAICSTWTLEPGSTMKVTGYGFTLYNELNINPKNTGTVPVQCVIDGTVYCEYTKSDEEKVYTADNVSYVDASGDSIAKPEGTLTQSMSKTVTGSPILANDASRDNAVIYISGGSIKGGTVTYTQEGDTVLAADSTDLGDTLNGKTKYKLTKAATAGFQEEYLSELPNLKCNGNTLNLSNTSGYTEKLSDSDTLETYLKSFGFNPTSVTFSDKTGLELLVEKTAGDVIQIPADSEFSKAANNETCTISTNLHNVGVGEVTNALKFTGTGATWDSGWNYDTLVFSGDNRNLVPECGVTYTDVNLTFCDANSWIAAPKDKAVSISGYDATVTICKDMELYHDLEIAYGTNFKGPENTKILVYGKLTFCGGA